MQKVPDESASRIPSSGFPPILGDSPRALVLGTLPSQSSLAKLEYYGHPRNAFWPIMAALFGATGGYEERCNAIKERGIAVWDVLAESVRPGSMDADIDSRTARPNPIAELVNSNDSLRLVCFNGRKARQLFERLVVIDEMPRTVTFLDLPSTSPAYAAMSIDDKTAAWRAVLARALPELDHI